MYIKCSMTHNFHLMDGMIPFLSITFIMGFSYILFLKDASQILQAVYL